MIVQIALLLLPLVIPALVLLIDRLFDLLDEKALRDRAGISGSRSQ